MDIYHMAALCLCLWLMYSMVTYTEKPSCVQCQGKGQHKPDCPFNKDKEND